MIYNDGNCDLCGHNEYTIAYRKDLTKKKYKVRRCVKCGFPYESDIRNEEIFKKK